MMLPQMKDWYVREVENPREEERQRRQTERALKVNEKLEFTPASPDDLAAIKTIHGLKYGTGNPQKHFAHNIHAETKLTARQRAYLWSIVWSHRVQIADTRLVELAKSIARPDIKPITMDESRAIAALDKAAKYGDRPLVSALKKVTELTGAQRYSLWASIWRHYEQFHTVPFELSRLAKEFLNAAR
jgi:hypothetical protein